MRKLIILFAALLPLFLLAQTQPVANNIGQTTNKHFNSPSGTRSIPPGVLVWNQIPNCDIAYACQNAPNYPFSALTADDFIFNSAPGAITAVRWWVLWYNFGYADYLQPSAFNVFIYNDVSCVPGSVVASWNVPFIAANEDAGCSQFYESREYWVNLSPGFVPVVGEHYWIVLQPVMDFPPQTMNIRAENIGNCPAIQIFPEAGITTWTPLSDDIAFQLYSSDAPVATPVSTWALVLGGVLIATAVFFRYRRMV